MSFDVVVAADLDWGIGKANGLPWPRLRGDLAHFRRITSAASEGRKNAIVMGRKTWESTEVNGKPLPNRFNFVVSRHGVIVPDGVGAYAVPSLDAALAQAPTVGAETTFVVGGAEIFRIAFDHPALRYIYLTRIDGHFDCDARLPPLDDRFEPVPWDGAQTAEENGVRYRIERLRRRPGT